MCENVPVENREGRHRGGRRSRKMIVRGGGGERRRVERLPPLNCYLPSSIPERERGVSERRKKSWTRNEVCQPSAAKVQRIYYYTTIATPICVSFPTIFQGVFPCSGMAMAVNEPNIRISHSFVKFFNEFELEPNRTQWKFNEPNSSRAYLDLNQTRACSRTLMSR